ncbi:MAG: hypothetical protein M9899_02685 [Bdellovibrionaceae bacterium]|nr:hypothetical protein [Pseudobdellovibrionaceae bacterium]
MQAIFALTLMLFSAQIFASQYDYNKLQFTDFEELRVVKSSAIKASRRFDYNKNPEAARKPLQEALRMFYSRPNQDNAIRTLAEDIESDLMAMGMFESTIANILSESKKVLNNDSLSSSVRATAVLCMNNALTEIKPKIIENVKLARVVCETADTKIKIPKDIQTSTHLRSMRVQNSPSETAKKIMLWYAKKKNVDVRTDSNPQGCPFSKRAT